MLSRAKRPDASFSRRELTLESASGYFEMGGFDDDLAVANAALAALQPELDARERRQNAARDDLKERLAGEAESIRESAGKMRKNEAEKRSFDEEAAALEEELDF